MTKEIDIDVSKFFDTPTIVRIKRMTFGEIAYLKDNTPFNIDPVTRIKTEKEGEAAMMLSQMAIVSAPFFKNKKPTLEEVKELDYELGIYLSEEISKFNNISPNV